MKLKFFLLKIVTLLATIQLTSLLSSHLLLAQDVNIEPELVIRTINGVNFLVEPDRKIITDPVTGLIIAEPIDRYMARKFKLLKDEKDKDIEQLEARIEPLEKKIAALELRLESFQQALQKPLWALPSVEEAE